MDQSEQIRPASAGIGPQELSAPQWAVISFERCEASGLTYEQAAATLQDLDRAGITGLCIVTDDAAARLDT